MVAIVFDAHRSATPRSVFVIDSVLFHITPTSPSSGTTRPLTGGAHAVDISTHTLVVPIGRIIREVKIHIARQADPIEIIVKDAAGARVAGRKVTAPEDHVNFSPGTGASIEFISPNNEGFLYSIEIT
jgi:hypothetical protein